MIRLVSHSIVIFVLFLQQPSEDDDVLPARPEEPTESAADKIYATYVLIACFHESWIFYFQLVFLSKKLSFRRNNSYIGIL
jgi:hypothetical protein